jgi:aromatase
MPRIENSVAIKADPKEVFDIINDIEKWPTLFSEYAGAKVISKERDGRYTEIIFELSNPDGASWRSWRLVDHKQLVAIAERRDPLYPFSYMHLKWTCSADPGGTRMTWIQDFELDVNYGVSLDAALQRMNTHTRENQQRIKEEIESGMAGEKG